MRNRISIHVILVVLFSVFLSGCSTNVVEPSANANVQSVINLAKNSSRRNDRDQILLDGVIQAKSVHDIIFLAKACSANSVRDRILLQGTKLANTSGEYIQLAKACSANSVRDRILLQGTKVASTNGEYIQLAQACSSPNNRDRILLRATEGSENVNGQPSDEVNRAYEEMQNAYEAYQNGLNEKLSKIELIKLAKEFKAKKAVYDGMLKN